VFHRFLGIYVATVLLVVLIAAATVGYLWCMQQVVMASRSEKRSDTETCLLAAVAPFTLLYWIIELS